MDYVGTVTREWWNGWFLNEVSELSTNVIWCMIGEWLAEWVRSELFGVVLVTETRFRGQEGEGVYVAVNIHDNICYGKGWYDKNQVSNQGEYTNPTESVKTEEIGMD